MTFHTFLVAELHSSCKYGKCVTFTTLLSLHVLSTNMGEASKTNIPEAFFFLLWTIGKSTTWRRHLIVETVVFIVSSFQFVVYWWVRFLRVFSFLTLASSNSTCSLYHELVKDLLGISEFPITTMVALPATRGTHSTSVNTPRPSSAAMEEKNTPQLTNRSSR